MATLFRPALELMTMYAAYHRDRRNIATHFVGIPMIVLGVSILLARPSFDWGGLGVTPLHALLVLSTLWYVTRGELLVGLATSAVNVVLAFIALQLASGGTASWLAWGIGAFVLGWVIQFIGHKYEGRKPAFVDDLVGLLVGPMFVTAEALFAAGVCKDLEGNIEAAVGPTRSGPTSQAA